MLGRVAVPPQLYAQSGAVFAFAGLNETLVYRAYVRQGTLRFSNTSLAGDATGDGSVSLEDFVLLRRNFGKSGARVDGDFNGDRRVDLNDFVVLRNKFGKDLVT